MHAGRGGNLTGSRRTVRTFLHVLSVAGALIAARAASAQIEKGDLTIELEAVASGLVSPVHLTHAGDGSGRVFVVDQSGPIRIIKDGVLLERPFLDLSSQIPVLNTGFDERGVLGLAFHPDYANNGRFFVRYSRPRTSGPIGGPCRGTSRGCHEEVLAEFRVSDSDPDVANPDANILFRIDKPEFNHNAGTVAFGPDGYLYFSLGDGGGANDDLHQSELWHTTQGNGQNIETPLGAMLRVDVSSSSPYAIPPDNPFLDGAGVNEIYAWGFRNPFRFSFDDGPGGDGRLYLGDVGQDVYEELNIVEKGRNYGWARREGRHCFDPFNPKNHPEECDTTGLTDPIVEYMQLEGGLSILAGYVYRGTQSPALEGRFIFGDFSMQFQTPSGRLYYLDEPTPGEHRILEFKITDADVPYGRYLKGFGRDEAGEIYVLGSTTLGPTGTTGEIHRIVAADDGCTGDERIAKAKCKTGNNGNTLKIALAGGRPGDGFTVTLSGGDDKSGTLNANGEATVKFKGQAAGDATATAAWNCGAKTTRDYTCP